MQLRLHSTFSLAFLSGFALRGSQRRADPLYRSSREIVLNGAVAVWNGSPALADLQAALDEARGNVTNRGFKWQYVTDPAAALILSLGRIRWSVLSARLLRDHKGYPVDMLKLAPLLVAKLAAQAVFDLQPPVKLLDNQLGALDLEWFGVGSELRVRKVELSKTLLNLLSQVLVALLVER